MKKLTLFFALFAIVSIAANAQEYKKFKVGLGGGYAIPGGSGAKGGVLFYCEPAYRIMDNIQVGARFEWAAMARGFSEDVGSAEVDVTTSGSIGINGQYYFSNESFRPFVGVGVSTYKVNAPMIVTEDGSFEIGSAENKIGFYPRVGFDAGHFTLSLDYNLVGASEYEVETFDGDTFKVESKNSYIGIRIGGVIGGGRN